MRHRVYGKHLGRDKDERDRLFKSLISQLILHGSVTISQAKAKAIKGLVDKVVNLAKEKRNHHLLNGHLKDKLLQERLIKEIIPALGNRNSGYTSLVRLGKRLGDQTMMVKMSLIGAEQLKPLQKVPQVERVPRVSRVERKAQKVKPRGTRDTSKTRGTLGRRKTSGKVKK